MAMQYKRHQNRNVIESELDEVITGEQKDNLIRILKEKLFGAANNIIEVQTINIIDNHTIEFTCRTRWDAGNVSENDKIIIDPDDDRTQGVCLRGMSSVYIGDARVYDDGKCVYDGVEESTIENEQDENRYYFSFCGNGTDENGDDYEDYFIFDTYYKLPYEKQSYPGIMF